MLGDEKPHNNFLNDNLAKLIINCYGNSQLSVHITNNMFFERVKYSRITT